MRLGCESCDLWTAPNMFWTPVRNAVRYEEPPHQLTSCPIETVRFAAAPGRSHAGTISMTSRCTKYDCCPVRCLTG